MKAMSEMTTDAAVLAAMVFGFTEVHKNPHANGRDFVIVPDGDKWKVEYLERPDLPHRKSGFVYVYDVASFCAYVNRHLYTDATVIYARLESAKFLALLNDHGPSSKGDAAGWGDHRCVFDMKHSPEYGVWIGKANKPLAQLEFGEFIEANLPDFVSPTGAAMYEIALNFRAKQDINYNGAIRTQSGDVEISYSQKTDSGAGAVTGKLTVPEKFTISIPVWAGLGQRKYEFAARLRYRLGGGTVSFYYELDRPHKVVERAFEDVLVTIKDKVKAEVIFGLPQGA